MATVTFDKATRQSTRATRVPAVDKLNIEIADGEFLVLVGPSGCGKSTSLRMLAGLEEVNGGRILIGDRDVTNLSAQGPRHRDGVPELRALPAHDGRRQHGLRAQDRRRRQGRDPQARRGGRQDPRPRRRTSTASRRPSPVASASASRWAARSSARPQVFLMDEPLSNLDAKLRVQTRTQIASLQRRLGVTTVYVTHDQVEAMTMGDRVAVLKDGLLQQCDSPRRMYDHPANVFVAGFIGSPAMNLLERAGHRRRRRPRRPHRADRARGRSADVGKHVTLGVRPEDLDLSSDAARASRSRSTSSRSSAPTPTSTAPPSRSCSRPPARTPAPCRSSRASTAAVPRRRARRSTSSPKPGHVHVFNAESGLRIGD